MSAVGGQVGGDCSVDFSRQRLGQNPREGALEWNGLWETLASTLPREPSSRSPVTADHTEPNETFQSLACCYQSLSPYACYAPPSWISS